MLNGAEYKIFLEADCLLCKKFKGKSDNNCGTNKKIELSIYMDKVTAEAFFPLKDLKSVPHVSKYICKKFEGKEANKEKAIETKGNQIGMF